ncbi:MAG: xanthine dehydrogenase family protein molybdopterin-binding subunit [Pseudomonadota bacterium]|nr:xanthine dehydrogenase family protein molybdopterin-binding subunit [Pseudomonadota bacterium]
MDVAARNPGAVGSEIGRSPARLMARRAVEGRGRYVDDLVLPRMLDVAYIRSPFAHADILGIDGSAAQAVPGVIAVIAGSEIAQRMSPWLGVMDNQPALKSVPQYALAVDRAMWQGEPVAAIVAETRAIAEDAAELVSVDWRERPAVSNMETALDPDTPVIHAELGNNRMYERIAESGDIEAGFAASAHIVDGTFQFGRHTGVTPEPRAIVSSYDPSEKRLTVYYGGQAPHMIQVLYSRHLDLPERDIRVLTQDCGGSYGIKSHLYGDEFATAVISIMLGRPVRWRADRIESFMSDIHARHHRVRARMGVDADGRILSFEIDDLVGGGPYSAFPRTSIVEGNQVINITGGPYRIPHFRGKTTVVFQNMVPISQYRAVGHPMGIVACDSLLEKAADAIGIDRLEIRRRNFVSDDSYPVNTPAGVALHDLSHQACLKKLAEIVDLDALIADRDSARAIGIQRGIGYASFIKGTNPGALIYGPAKVPVSAQDGCTVRFEPAGGVTCLIGVTEQGQGTETMAAQVVASAIGVEFENVRVITGDTDAMPYGGGTYGSRGAGIGGEAAWRAAIALRAQILELAGVLLQADPLSLDIRNGIAVDAKTGTERITLSELGAIVFLRSYEMPDDYHPNLVATERFRVRDYIFTNAAHAAYVEVDTDTGFLRVLKYWLVEDCGRVINPQLVAEQQRGSVVQGLGDALYEHCIYDNAGQLLNATMADYLVPMSAEMPDIVVDHVVTPTSKTALGAKGAGESGTAGAPQTILSAVNDAIRPLGSAVSAVPVTPEDVLRALDKG